MLNWPEYRKQLLGRIGEIAKLSPDTVGIAGIQQMGGDFYVEPLFNGATLLVAIGIAGYAQRRRRSPRRGPIGNAPVMAPAAEGGGSHRR